MCGISFSRRMASTSNSPSEAATPFPSIRTSIASFIAVLEPFNSALGLGFFMVSFAEAWSKIGQFPACSIRDFTFDSLRHCADSGVWKGVVIVGITRIQTGIILFHKDVQVAVSAEIDRGIYSHLVARPPGANVCS